MTWTHTLTGILIGCSMLLQSCQFADADFGFGLEVVAPKIIRVIHRFSGKRYSITCKVMAGGLEMETLVYWLANDTFVESDSRVTTREKCVDGYIRTKLVFKEVMPEHRATNFTCIALNPAGFDKSTTTLCKSI